MGTIVKLRNIRIGEQFIHDYSICKCVHKDNNILIVEKPNGLPLNILIKFAKVDLSHLDQNKTYDGWSPLPTNTKVEKISVKNNKLNQKLYKDTKTGEDDEYIYY